VAETQMEFPISAAGSKSFHNFASGGMQIILFGRGQFNQIYTSILPIMV
jgi:hypothetical protein